MNIVLFFIKSRVSFCMYQLFNGIMAEIFTILLTFVLWQQCDCWSSSHRIHVQKDRIRQRWNSNCIREQCFPDNALTNWSLCHIDQIFVTWPSLFCLYSRGRQKRKELRMSIGSADLKFFHTLPDLSIELPTVSSSFSLRCFQGTSESTYQKLNLWCFL